MHLGPNWNGAISVIASRVFCGSSRPWFSLRAELGENRRLDLALARMAIDQSGVQDVRHGSSRNPMELAAQWFRNLVQILFVPLRNDNRFDAGAKSCQGFVFQSADRQYSSA